MTYWKIEFTGEPPASPPWIVGERFRVVIQALTMDKAVDAARDRFFGADPARMTTTSQAMDEIEVAHLDDATAHFLKNGFRRYRVPLVLPSASRMMEP